MQTIIKKQGQVNISKIGWTEPICLAEWCKFDRIPYTPREKTWCFTNFRNMCDY